MDGMSKTVGTSARHFFGMTRSRAGLAVLCPEDGIFYLRKVLPGVSDYIPDADSNFGCLSAAHANALI
jgi:hypothetical protein